VETSSKTVSKSADLICTDNVYLDFIISESRESERKEREIYRKISCLVSDQSVWIVFFFFRLRQMMQLIAFKRMKLLSLGAEFFSQ
jgi:hypothetical protein